MAGAVDIHSHIAGSNVTMARLLMPELGRRPPPGEGVPRSRSTPAAWGAFATGIPHARDGLHPRWIEPAVILHPRDRRRKPSSPVIPIIDKGGLVILGNDDFYLGAGAGRCLPVPRSRTTSPGRLATPKMP